ncbi:hypothetical protein ACTFBT_01235 [Streptomyces microflavus]|uniref:hypothetical protein n=1 Tax=Streptomyces TaxID=1883 RepID=UPI00051661A9|nr:MULTISPECIES: hypothetical protein [Streptomyces]MDX2978150.1 hypothetical protein [Streptomyces sp. NRRL_B-2249]GGX67151.1 hypothetical protein GCM10010298_34850 [Streptomyces microflavus]
MAPEIIIAVISSVAILAAAVVAALPALLTALRRTRSAVDDVETSVQAQGAETRAATVDAMTCITAQIEAMGSRLDSRIDDVRDDIDDVREDITRVREWQAGHDAEHIISRPRTGGDAA